MMRWIWRKEVHSAWTPIGWYDQPITREAWFLFGVCVWWRRRIDHVWGLQNSPAFQMDWEDD